MSMPHESWEFRNGLPKYPISQIKVEDSILDIYDLPNNVIKISGKSTAEVIGEKKLNIPRVLSFKNFTSIPGSELIRDSNKGWVVCVFPVDYAIDFWSYYASKGNSKAQRLVSKIEKNPRVLRVTNITKANNQALEKEIQYQLADEYNGEMEISTPCGRIDILTPTKLLEVKKVQAWKTAIGQVLAYGIYYPSHQKVIVLFGEYNSEQMDTIEHVCRSLNIDVWWR